MRSINETEKLLTTPIYQWHCKNNANMASFGSYKLPLWFDKGAKAEHLAVLATAGLFDTSHMTALILTGDDSFNLLQHFFSRDLSRLGKNKDTLLPTGKGVYGVFLNAEGCLLDDSIIYRVDKTSYFICLNSGKGPLIANHLHSYAGSYSLSDLTGSLTKIDLQGPNAAKILAHVVTNPTELFTSFPAFTCKGSFAPFFWSELDIRSHAGTPLFIARSGYTGEFGFEIFSAADNGLALWEEVLEAGKSMHIMPCGLACRDSLRVGAVLPLAGQDIGNWPFVNTPWSFALPYDDSKRSFSKNFFGSKKLLGSKDSYTYAFAGYDLRKVDGETAVVLNSSEKQIGTVLSCVTDMAIGRINQKIIRINSPDRPHDLIPKGLCCGFLKAASPLSEGEKVVLKDERRKIDVEIVQSIRPDCTARLPLADFL